MNVSDLIKKLRSYNSCSGYAKTMLIAADELEKATSNYIVILKPEFEDRYIKYKKGWERWEKLKKLDLSQYSDLYILSLQSDKSFDTIIDNLKCFNISDE